MLTALYSAALLLSALLLFSIQPLFTKMALPLLGGSAAVWTTAQVFFQATLFLGYVYAHWLSRWLPRKPQVLVHLVVIALVVAALPIGISPDANPPAFANPIAWFLGLLAISVGLPFFALATTAPLLQRWYAYARGASADPYFLYAASNFGGLVALIGYPVLIEPMLGLQGQSTLWALTYICLVVLIAGIGAQVYRVAGHGIEPETFVADSANPPAWRQRFRWLLLAFAPSALLLSVTLHINTDVATFPVLWVVPLSLYLLSFVLVFARHQLVRYDRLLLIQPVILVALTMFFSTGKLLVDVGLHLCTLFLVALVCHGELARTRPGPRFLTQFYLWLSFGGLLGGVFAGVVAPLVFDSVLEYPLILGLACVLGMRPATGGPAQKVWDVVLPVSAGVLFVAQDRYLRGASFDSAELVETAITILFGLVLYSFRKRPYRLALGILAILLPAELVSNEEVLEQRRSFYGVHRVITDGQYQLLTNGTTVHGAEHRVASRQNEPLTYYYPGGPLGQVFRSLDRPPRFMRVGIIGLGAGAIACYRPSSQTRYTFFEIDPIVVEIAADPRLFRFLSLCGENVEVVLGDGRRSLSQVEDQTFDLLILDAFSSDSIPSHLLTREALTLYFRKLSPNGVLVIHLSNRNLELEPVVAALVEDASLVGHIQHHEPTSGGDPYWWKSTWAVIARSTPDTRALTVDSRWKRLESNPPVRPWTDDYSNILGAIKWPGTN